jgi:L-iditol 2-dehydrogenase
VKAAVLYQPHDIRIEERATPEPGPGEVLIRIKACGVCGTDNALFVGEYPARYPVVIGHEFSGEIIEVGREVADFTVGDRVTVDPNRVCHRCGYCRSGNEHLCDNLRSMGVHSDGAVAEYCTMAASNVYRLPDGVTFEEAAFCEPLACAVHGVDQVGVRLGDTVLIIGAGGMGNLIGQCARRSGAAQIVVSEPIAFRRERAAENGATHLIDPSKEDVAQALRKINPRGADVVFEVAGRPAAQAAAVYLVKKGGSVVFFGCSPSDKTIEVNPFYINENELKIFGSFNNQFSTGRALDMLASHACRVDNLISHRFRLEEYLQVFRMFGGKETLKIMISLES